MKLDSFQFPDRQISDIPTSVPPSLFRFAQQVGADTSELPRRLVVTGRHVVGETIDLPSGFTLELRGAHLVQAAGTFCNLFRADGAENVAILGFPGADGAPATLDGGEWNGLHEKNAGRDGRPPIWVNSLALFTNVRGFRVEGVHCQNQRWWALTFIGCSDGSLRRLSFLADHTSVTPEGELLPCIRLDRYAEIRVKNADGIDIRAGCHDIAIEDVSGFTEDDTVAITCLPGALERTFLPEGTPLEIRDIAVRRVHAASCCSLVRLLAQGGGRVRRVRVEDVRDTSDGKTYMDGYTHRGVNIGDDHAYATPPAVPEDMADITIRGVRARRVALLTRGAFTRLAAENVSS